MTIPELGPLLGSLVEPAGSPGGSPVLDDARLAMVAALFERAHAARTRLAAQDERGARAALGAAAWLAIWDDAARRSTVAVIQKSEQQIRDAAQRSRYPKQRLARELPSAEDRRILGARFSAEGLGLEAAVTALEGPLAGWPEAQRRAAGELEQAWRRLLAAAGEELAQWEGRAATVGVWRRPWWPLLTAGAAVLALATWSGLMLGGYLPVPDALRPAAEWFWSLPWP